MFLETTIQKGEFHNIRYDCIPNIAFQKYFNVFKNKDNISFNIYLKNTDVIPRKTSSQFPHDILCEYNIFETDDVKPSVETKWAYFLKHYNNVNITKTIPILHSTWQSVHGYGHDLVATQRTGPHI